MTNVLPTPTVELVKVARDQFDQDNRVMERALTALFQQYPANNDPSLILLKVVAVNALYRTSIYAVETAANHIFEKVPNLDLAIQSGLQSIVDEISHVQIGPKTFNFFSFASKYCSWHKPDLYPIYDSRVDRYLWTLHKQGPFSKALKHRSDLWVYSSFYQIISDFRVAFELEEFSFKDIDKFLYMYSGFDLPIEHDDSESADVI